MKIKAAVVDKQGEPMSIQEVDIREPLDNEVRVKIVGAGVCHTDIAHANNEWNIPLPMPMVMGHEGAGIVESVGPGVTKVKPGDHVIVSNPSCGQCDACNGGKEWYCEQSANLHILLDGVDFFGTTPLTRDGEPVHILFQQSSFAEYCVSNQRCITKIPDDFDLKLAGPIGCALRTGAGSVYNVLKPTIGEWVLCNGAGPVGLAAMWVAKAMGAQVVVVDINDERLKLAKETGADQVVNTRGMSQEEAVQAILNAMGGKGAHHMVEATAVPSAIKTAMLAVRGGGQVAQAAVANEINFDSWFFGPVDSKIITFIRMGNVSNDIIIPVICDLYKKGQFPLEKIITYYKFEDILQAMDDCVSGKVIKPVLLFD